MPIGSEFKVSRIVPTPASPDGTLLPPRSNKYGEVYGNTLISTRHALSDEGTYLLATNPTVSTGFTWVLAQTAFSDTTPNFYIYNGETPSNANSKSIYIDYLKLITTTAATASTAIHFAFILDTVARNLSTDNTQTITPVSPNGNTSIILLPTVKVQNSATASVIVASSPNKRIVSRGVLGGLNVVGDELQINFGSLDAGAQSATTAAEGAGQPGRRVTCSSPIIIGAGQSLTGHFWLPASTASINPEMELGMFIR